MAGASGTGLGVSIPEVAGRARAPDPATAALIARMSAPPPVARVALIDALVRALKSAGVWARLDCLYVLAAHDAQAARLNWVGAANDLAAVNSPVFTTDRGYAGDGATAYLDTGWVFPAGYQNSAHLMAWSRSSGASASFVMIGNANAVISLRRSSDEQDFARVNSSTSAARASTDASGMFVAARTGSLAADFAFYRNGAVVAVTGATASEAPDTSYPLRILGRNGSIPGFTDRQIAAASAGAGLSAGEVAALHAALSTYLAAVGAA